MVLSSNDTLLLLESLLAKSKEAKLLNKTSSFRSDVLGVIAEQDTIDLPVDLGYAFAAILVFLGSIAIILNSVILAILIRRHRYVFKHVFYLLLVNFAAIDALKGACLICWAAKTLAPTSGTSILILKVDQFALLLLRFCNLATIINLLMITLNEFCFIVYPLRYRTMVTKSRAISLVALCWTVSLTFTVLTMLSGSKKQTVYINPLCIRNRSESVALSPTQPTADTGEETETLLGENELVDYDDVQSLNWDHSLFSQKIDQLPTVTSTTPASIATTTTIPCVHILRDDDTSLDAQYIFLFTIIGFCICCFLIAAVCYAILFRVISRIVRQDMELFIEVNRIQRATMDREGRMSISTDLKSGDSSRINKQLVKRHKYVLVIGSVLVVYMLYLLSYSFIQLLQFNRLSAIQLTPRKTIMARLALQTMIGLHSIMQPLCYFRNKEFRSIFIKSLSDLWQQIRHHPGDDYRHENGFMSSDMAANTVVHTTGRRESGAPIRQNTKPRMSVEWADHCTPNGNGSNQKLIIETNGGGNNCVKPPSMPNDIDESSQLLAPFNNDCRSAVHPDYRSDNFCQNFKGPNWNGPNNLSTDNNSSLLSATTASTTAATTTTSPTTTPSSNGVTNAGTTAPNDTCVTAVEYASDRKLAPTL